MTWNGEAVFDAAHAEATRRVEAVGQMIARRMQSRVSMPYPPASKADTPPHLRSGDFAGSITYLMLDTGNVVQASMGSFDEELVYPKMLEEGTSKMAARPWCLSTFVDNQAEVGATLTTGQQSAGAGSQSVAA